MTTPIKKVRALPRKVLLNDDQIEPKLIEYPEEIHDSIRWLAAFTRDVCNRDIRTLEAHCKKLGLNRSSSTTYFTKVLNFTYPFSTGGAAALDNFIQTIDILKGDRAAAVQSGRVPFIETTTYQRIRDYIDTRRMPDSVCKFGLIVGATGTQKTASTKHYQSVNNHGKVVHIESPERPSINELVTDLASRYGAARSLNKSRKMLRIRESVNENRTIICENIQRLYVEGKGWQQPVFNYFQKLQDDTGCTVIFTCTTDFLTTFSEEVESKGYFEQFEGRCGGSDEFLVLDDYPPATDVKQIAKAFGFQDIDSELKQLSSLAHRRGRVRVLFKKLQDGARLANSLGEPLNINHLAID
ncbi:AAA family ATPase [Coraliomargarita sp. W4R72]